MSKNYSENDWRTIMEPALKTKYEVKKSYAYANRNRLTRLSNHQILHAGKSKQRAQWKVLIAIDCKSKFTQETIDAFLSQVVEFFKDEICHYLKVYVCLFNGENISEFMDLESDDLKTKLDGTEENDYANVITKAKRRDMDEILFFTDGKNVNPIVNVKEPKISYCFDTVENCEKSEVKQDKGVFNKES